MRRSGAPPASGRDQLTRYVLHLLPAALTAALLLDILGGVAGGIMGFALLLVAPGWLVWKLIPNGILVNSPPALPALWLVFSFTVLSPALAGAAFFGWPVETVEFYLLVVLVGLGIGGARVASPTVAPWGTLGIGLTSTAAAAVVYRLLTWHDSSDDLSYVGFATRIVEDGEFPTSNPFLTGGIPLSQRWRLDGWTGITGVISHLGDASPVNVYMDIFPALLVLFGASALFILAMVLSGDIRFAHYAAFAGLLVPLLTGTGGKTYFKYWYKSVAQNKYSALIVFLPVVAALLVAAYRSRHRLAALLGALTLWAMLFVHPVPAVFAVLAFGTYVILDLLINRPDDWPARMTIGLVMLVPLTLSAVAVSFTGERFGTRLGDVETFSDVAELQYDFGPVEIWEPIDLSRGSASADPAQITAVFATGHMIGAAGPRVAFLGEMPIAHWRMLGNPGNLLVALAIVVMILGRRRDPITLWVLASTLVAVSVFVIPPFAALAARFITPWQLWRFSWLMPVPLAVVWLLARGIPESRHKPVSAVAAAALLIFVLAASPHGELLNNGPSRADRDLDAVVAELEGLEGTLLASTKIQNAATSRHAGIDVVSYRGLATMANNFPSTQRSEAFDRLQDSSRFFRNSFTNAEREAVLDEYDVRYVLAERDDRFATRKRLGLEPVREVGRDLILYERTPSGS